MLTALTDTIEPTPVLIGASTVTTIVVYLFLTLSIGVALVGATLVSRQEDHVQRHDLHGDCIVVASVFAANAFGARIYFWFLGDDIEPFALGQPAWIMLGLAAGLTAINAMDWYLTLPLPGEDPGQGNAIQTQHQDPR